MRKRSRTASTFTPNPDELEKLAGASVLAFGVFPGPAIAFVAQVGESDSFSPHDPLDGSSERDGAAIAEGWGRAPVGVPDPPAAVAATSHSEGASASQPIGARPGPTGTAETSAGAGVIRSLALAPTAQPESTPLAGILFPAASAGATADVAARPSAAGMWERVAGPAVAARPVAPMGGYVATGGASGTARVPSGQDVATSVTGSSGSSGGGTTATATVTRTSMSTNTSGASGSGGTYTITGTGPSGGWTATGKLTLNVVGNNMIGGGANCYLGVEGSGPDISSIVASSIQWSYSGATPIFGTQPVPNPNGTPPDTAFVNTPKNPSASNGSTSFGFNWGATPGGGTVTVSADVMVNGRTDNATVNVHLGCVQPDFLGTVTYKTATKVIDGWVQDWFRYGKANSAGPGIEWDLDGSAGYFGVVQVINSATYRKLVNGAVQQSFIKRNPTTGAIIPAPWPLVDVFSSDTTPWYSPPSNAHTAYDAPGFTIHDATSATFKFNATDYIMFNAGGMWVPHAKFTWNVDATALWDTTTSSWTVTDVTAPSVTGFTITHTSWPSWGGVAANWLGMVS